LVDSITALTGVGKREVKKKGEKKKEKKGRNIKIEQNSGSNLHEE
jgi:hypothetical protein